MSRRVSWSLALILILVFGLLLFSCTSDSGTQPIVIGAIVGLTGDVASYGKRVYDGMELALQEINAAGGVDSRPLQVIYEDNQGNPSSAVSAFQKLVDVNHVSVIIGPMLSSESLATAPLANRRRIVQLSTLAGTIKLRDAGDYVFRLFPSDEFQGEYLAKQAYNEFGSRRAAIVYLNNAYGTGIRDVITEVYTRLGGEVIMSESLPEGGINFNAQLAKVKAAKPDLIFGVMYYNEGGQFLAQAFQQGIDTRILGGDAWFGPIQNVAGRGLEQLVFSSVAFGPNQKNQPAMRRFIDTFKKRYGASPDSYNATGYDAVYAVKLALDKGGMEAERIKDALYSAEFRGALGQVRFDKNGDNVGAEFSLFQMTNEGILKPYTYALAGDSVGLAAK